MDLKSLIEQQIEETLSSLDNISRANPPPFIYTRIQARLLKHNRNGWEAVSRFVTKPAFAFISIGLVVAVNTFAIMKFTSDETLPQDQQELAMADEYNRTTSMINYNIDNVQP